MTLDTHNPCRTCAACCNAFRVSFHWSEASPLSLYQVPEDLIEQVSPHVACMRGTHAHQPGCAAHVGDVGVSSGCSVYETALPLAARSTSATKNACAPGNYADCASPGSAPECPGPRGTFRHRRILTACT